jgi:hypothetical protein
MGSIYWLLYEPIINPHKNIGLSDNSPKKTI